MRKSALLVAFAATLTGCTPVVVFMTPVPPPALGVPAKAVPQQPSARGQ